MTHQTDEECAKVELSFLNLHKEINLGQFFSQLSAIFFNFNKN